MAPLHTQTLLNRYFLMRHGEGEHNRLNVLSSWPENPPRHLTEDGHTQVQVAAQQLQKVGIDLIFSSDLVRTKETAEVIANELGLPIVYDARLRESNFGDFDGQDIVTFHDSFPSPLVRFTVPPPGGESLHDVRHRIMSFVKELEDNHQGKSILIVSHGDPLWMLETGFAGLSDADTLKTPLRDVGTFWEMSPNL